MYSKKKVFDYVGLDLMQQKKIKKFKRGRGGGGGGAIAMVTLPRWSMMGFHISFSLCKLFSPMTSREDRGKSSAS